MAKSNMNFIPLMVPSIIEDDIQAAVRVLRSGMLVQGIEVENFENKVRAKLNVKHAIAASNGTATLHMALLALGVGKGDEVIVPAFSYTATANVVEIVGARPVFVDIRLQDFNIDVEKIESEITAKTKVIIPVHEFGLACDIIAVKKIADAHNIYVIEDSACALGAYQHKKFVGNYGHFGSFSFHPRKAITSGEGGILTTNDDQMAEKIRILRNHGIKNLNGNIDFVEAGFNYRMTDFQAAMLNKQIERLDKIISIKQDLANLYSQLLQNPLIKIPSIPYDRNHTWQTYHILLNEKINRNQVIDSLKKQGVGSNYGAQCIPEQSFYKNKYKLNSKKLFPNAYFAYRQGLALPLYEKLNTNDIYRIVDSLNKAIFEQC